MRTLSSPTYKDGKGVPPEEPYRIVCLPSCVAMFLTIVFRNMAKFYDVFGVPMCRQCSQTRLGNKVLNGKYEGERSQIISALFIYSALHSILLYEKQHGHRASPIQRLNYAGLPLTLRLARFRVCSLVYSSAAGIYFLLKHTPSLSTIAFLTLLQVMLTI